MKHATRPGGPAQESESAPLIRLVHLGLMTAGLASALWVGAGRLGHDTVSFADTGAVVEEEVAEAEAPAMTVPLVPVPAMQAAAVKHPAVVKQLGAIKPPGAVVGLSSEMQRVRDYVARRYRVSTVALEPVLAAAEANGQSAGIDPLLIVAVMAIESSFNPFAESHMGARGLMQVIPRFHMDKIGEGRGEDALFDPLLNVEVGTLVLVEGLKRFGSLQGALQYYGGALNDPNASYASKVLALKARLVTAAGRAAGAGA